MKLTELEKQPDIKFKIETTKGKSYVIRATAKNHGEVGMLIIIIKNKIGKVFYEFIDKDFKKIKRDLYRVAEMKANKLGVKLNVTL